MESFRVALRRERQREKPKTPFQQQIHSLHVRKTVTNPIYLTANQAIMTDENEDIFFLDELPSNITHTLLCPLPPS